MKCIYKDTIEKLECEKTCEICEKRLKEKGIYYTTNGFIQYAKKE
jgi:hypothetical protein